MKATYDGTWLILPRSKADMFMQWMADFGSTCGKIQVCCEEYYFKIYFEFKPETKSLLTYVNN